MDAVLASREFVFELQKQLAKEYAGKSCVCSPYAVWQQLASLTSAVPAVSKSKYLASLKLKDITDIEFLPFAAAFFDNQG